jgi:hypothetical protein
MNSESSDLCTYAQKDYIAMINDRACKFLNAALECDLLDKPFDRREANSWIEYLHLRRRLECLRAMDLNAGDLVQKFDDDETAIEEVVSISNEGRVYFKGGLGASAWPDNLRVRARKDENSPLRSKAHSRAALRTNSDTFGRNKQQELSQFEVNRKLTGKTLICSVKLWKEPPTKDPCKHFSKRDAHLRRAGRGFISFCNT